tara:strand:+ start:185 stop:403 length:219 start_codon:yes stop_codon:yes gene_type:complete
MDVIHLLIRFKQRFFNDFICKFEVFIFKNAGHSWDCNRCKKDVYNQKVSKEALDKSIKFFEKHADLKTYNLT